MSSDVVDHISSITFVTHGTLNYIRHLLLLKKRWIGPISIALNVPNVKLYKVYNLLHRFVFCSQKSQSSLHILLYYSALQGICYYPMKQIFQKLYVSSSNLENCAKETDIIIYLLALLSKYPDDAYYSRNIGRNIARNNVRTNLQLTADLELIPSTNFQKAFSEFFLLRRQKNNVRAGKVVYLVPAFEVKQGIQAPSTKHVLQELYIKGIAPRFKHVSQCSGCFGVPKLATWISQNSSYVNVFMALKYIPLHWEPIYVEDSGVPSYDIKLGGIGFDKVQQLYEMCRANFTFFVMDGMFISHVSTDVHEIYNNTATFVNIAKNFATFAKAKEKLNVEYPEKIQAAYCNNWQPLFE